MNKKLHILFLSGWYPSRVLPSNGDFVKRHAEAVATRHKVTLVHVVTDQNINKKENFEERINNVLTKIVYIPKASNSFFKFFLFLKIYLNEINSVDSFHLTHLNITFPKGIIALYLKFFKKKPYIVSEHWSDYQANLNHSIGYFTKLITKLIIKNAAFVCPVTKHLQNSMIKFGLKGNYHPIPNVVDLTIFSTSNTKNNEFVVTHISGMDDKIKNITGILNSMKKIQLEIQNLKINLIGKNSNAYKALIKKNALSNISIIDHINQKKVAEYLKKSDVFILFSNYENLPCVIIESFSCGVPVISTNVGGVSEYFPKDFGYLINTNDETSLENSILKIYRKELIPNKNKMHNYAEINFGPKAISESFSKLYFQTLNNKL